MRTKDRATAADSYVSTGLVELLPLTSVRALFVALASAASSRIQRCSVRTETPSSFAASVRLS